MHEKDGTLVFDRCDFFFLKRFGPIESVEMVRNFQSTHKIPFLYDTYQLGTFLDLSRTDLFAMTRNPEKWYYPVVLNKRNGGLRQLHVPFPKIRCVQQIILQSILSKMPLSPYAMAYRRGRSVLHNASPHCSKTYLLKMDICDFFGSIRFDQVYRAVFHTGHFPKQIGAMLTSLCCYQEHLPQGAPTSPALSNLVMRHFDDAMGAWCERHGVTYTRYSDDLTFSSDKSLYGVYRKAKQFLEDMGFEVNEKKTCFVTGASKKLVTGLVVNEEHPTVSREERRMLRQELYYVEKFGPADAILKGNRTAFIDQNGEPQPLRYIHHLLGRLRYIRYIMKDEEAFRISRAMLNRISEQYEI